MEDNARIASGEDEDEDVLPKSYESTGDSDTRLANLLVADTGGEALHAEVDVLMPSLLHPALVSQAEK